MCKSDVFTDCSSCREKKMWMASAQCLQKSLSFEFRMDVHSMTTIPPFEKVLLLLSSQSYNRGILQFWEPYINNACQSSINVPTQYTINRFVLCNSLKASALWLMMCVLWFSLWLNTDHLLKYQCSEASDGFPSASVSVSQVKDTIQQ